MAAMRSLAAGAAVLGLAAACSWVAVRQLDLPVVFVDAGSGDCVAVLSPDPEHGCHNLPARYVREWAAPGAAAQVAALGLDEDYRRQRPEQIDVDGAPRGLYGKEGRALEDDPEPLIIYGPFAQPEETGDDEDERREVVAAALATAGAAQEYWFEDGDTFVRWTPGHGSMPAAPGVAPEPAPVPAPASLWLLAGGAGALMLRRAVHAH